MVESGPESEPGGPDRELLAGTERTVPVERAIVDEHRTAAGELDGDGAARRVDVDEEVVRLDRWIVESDVGSATPSDDVGARDEMVGRTDGRAADDLEGQRWRVGARWGEGGHV